MLKKYKFIVLLSAVILIAYACSTEKNTVINRAYHGMTAHYNGYFNARELMNQSIRQYRDNKQDDFYELLPLMPVPNEEEVVSMYPMIDTASAKIKKVIGKHAMPSFDKPAKKKDENNNWIDNNWIQLGICSYYRRDYEQAMKNFKFVNKFFDNDPSLFEGALWMAKTNLATGDITEAKFNLDYLDNALAEEKERKKEKTNKKYRKKSKKKDKPAKFPQRILFDFEVTKADFYIARGDDNKAIEHIKKAIKKAKYKNRFDKIRLYYVLGQLYEKQGDNTNASESYKVVAKKARKFDLMFNAQLKQAFLGGEKVEKKLKKLLKDAKNAPFKDQIYYALGDIELKNGNEEKGIEYLTKCAFYSTANTRQKGMAYERLGDMQFDKKEYVSAQKYYDSCAAVIEDTYPNAEGIRTKAEKLSDLVVAVETAEYEDSVQQIALMSESDRTKFLQNVIKKIEKEEQERKERDAEKMLALQQNENLFSSSASGSKWYWNNAKAKTEGFQEFKRLWGERENVDNWRRSLRVVESLADKTGNENDSTFAENKVEEDSLTVKSLLANIPLNDSALTASNHRLMEAYYNAGFIYQVQLNEPNLAVENYQKILDKDFETEYDVMSAYQLFQLYREKNPTEAGKHKNYILNHYPNSDYANFLRDPDYFIKKKERDALAEQEYVRVLKRYNLGVYYPVIIKANQVINNEKDNVFRAKYMLLKAMATGQNQEDKTQLLPTLQQVIDEYPETSEAQKAQEMIDIIKNGYSTNKTVDFSNKGPFEYDDKVELQVFIMLPQGTSNNGAKARITDFSREFFSQKRLRIDAKILGKEGIVMVKSFKNESEASRYIGAYKRTRKHLLDLNQAKIFMITQENLKILFQKRNLAEYEKFYEEYY